MPEVVPTAAAVSLDALRGRGADRFDPVRFHFLEALARRAHAHTGAARHVLDDRLAQRIAAYEADARAAVPGDTGDTGDRGDIGDAGERIDAQALAPGPLAELVARMARRCPVAARGEARSTSSASGAAPPTDMTALASLRRTWARLSVEQRLAQSLSALPGNAGPLNSHQLVHRALTLMREISPAYLERFAAYTDALLWVEQTLGANARDLAKEAATPRAPTARKTSRSR